MFSSRTIALLLGTVLLCAPCMAQRGHRNPPDIFQDESKMPAATYRGPDPKVMLDQANQLRQLSNSIPDDIEKMSKGMISKDLAQRLMQIEKLAKKLRSEVQQ